MDIDWTGVVFRWMHILAAITAVGGTIFMRVAFLPGVSGLPDEERRSLQETVRSRWSKLVGASIGLLIISGLYNIGTIAMRFELPGYYMPLFIVKITLALAIFFLSSALAGKSPAFEKIRQNARLWITVNMILAIILVCISGVLRTADKTKKPVDGVISASLDVLPASLSPCLPISLSPCLSLSLPVTLLYW